MYRTPPSHVHVYQQNQSPLFLATARTDKSSLISLAGWRGVAHREIRESETERAQPATAGGETPEKLWLVPLTFAPSRLAFNLAENRGTGNRSRFTFGLGEPLASGASFRVIDHAGRPFLQSIAIPPRMVDRCECQLAKSLCLEPELSSGTAMGRGGGGAP
mgnify:CR=1 FL=1